MKQGEKSRPANRLKPPLRGAAAAKSESPKGKRRRIMDGLITLSSAAIVSVYTLGYLNTRAADDKISAQVVASAPAPASASRSAGTSVPAPTPTPLGLSQTQPQAVTYRDGTYVGQGTSRHGGIEATVVIKGGKISSASISRCQTRYPCSDVNALVQEVVARQAVPVDHVSRATDSSNAYKQAVASALSGAKQQVSAQAVAPAPTPTTAPRSAGTPAPAPTPAPAGPSQAQPQMVTYRDGTYVGQGTSRHGGIEATLVIKGGKISSASISRCQTRYPCSDVNALVQEVVARQVVPVGHVSRATDSSNAYKQAVANALSGAS
ncbi:MAG: FMN-binding protein [Dehalococcoidia bacterium]|nr:FMN-binding protein [Dehalococcoidia bacterium]